MAIRQFYRGSATFKCDVCGRTTRDTGATALGSKLCVQCWELAGIENEISDGGATLEQRRDMIKGYVAEIASKGGDTTEWATTFDLTTGKDGK